MSMIRKAILASAIISSGLVSTAGLALAADNDGAQDGLVNSSDFTPSTAANACSNDVPVNVLGVQIPVQDNALGVPAASEAEDGNGAANAKSCSNPIDSDN